MEQKYFTSLMSNIVLVAICVILSLLLYKGCKNQAETNQAYNALVSEVHTYRSKSNKEVSEREVLLSEFNSLQSLISKKDEELNALKKEVGKNTVSVVTHTIHTIDTVYLTVHDTTNKGYNYHDEWADISVTPVGDSMEVAYSIKNDFTHKLEWKRKNVLSPSILYGSVVNNNPHSYTDKYFAYHVRPPRQQGIKVGIFAIGVGAGILITKAITK